MMGIRATVAATAATLVVCIAVTPAVGQKGTGETTGVARERAALPIHEMSGTVTDVEIGACELTTGRMVMGAHLIVSTGTEDTVNLHLGPVTAVQPVLGLTPPGTELSFEAFQTAAMPEDAYVAKSITVEDKTFALRDDTLRPSWAASRQAGAGRGMGGPGQGMGSGPGQGQGPGQGMGEGPGQGMGPGSGQGMGPGSGDGQRIVPGPGQGGGAGAGSARRPCWW